jgi:competence protein ComEC
MRGKKALSILLALLFIGALSWLYKSGMQFIRGAEQPSLIDARTLIVKVLDVGQGDSILIRQGASTVLVDTSDVGMRGQLMNILTRERVKKIDLLVATHPHADHIGGMERVIERIAIGEIWDSGQVATSRTFTNYLRQARSRKVAFTKVKPGDSYQLAGGARLDVLWPPTPFLRGTDSDLNNNSIVLRLSFGKFAMLLTGDIQKEAEAALVKGEREKIRANVLKAPHHSSNTSSTSSFLRAVAAKDVIVSCGEGNEYGFPKPKVLKRYRDNGMEVYVTATDGTVTVTTDGESYKITKEKRK